MTDLTSSLTLTRDWLCSINVLLNWKVGWKREERNWTWSRVQLNFSLQRTGLPKAWNLQRIFIRSLNFVENKKLRKKKSFPSRERRYPQMPRSSSRDSSLFAMNSTNLMRRSNKNVPSSVKMSSTLQNFRQVSRPLTHG